MREIADWLPPEVMRLMGLVLLHFLWQGLALAALAYVVMSLLRSAASRYAIRVAVLALVVARPPITYFASRNRSDARAEAKISIASASVMHNGSIAPTMKSPITPLPDVPATSLAWLVQAWFAGVLLCSLRTAAGLFWIERL